MALDGNKVMCCVYLEAGLAVFIINSIFNLVDLFFSGSFGRL